MDPGDTLLSRRNERRPSRWVPGIATLLVLFALVPLGGAALFALREYDTGADARARSSALATVVDRLVDDSKLRLHILDEHDWTLVSDGIATLGWSAADVETVVGLDVDEARRRAADEVDRLAGALGEDDVVRSVRELRTADIDPTARSAGYLAVERASGAAADRRALDVQRSAGLAGGGDEVIVVHLLDRSIDARHAVALQLSTYLAGGLSGNAGGNLPLRTLIAQQAAYDEAIGDLEVLAAGTAVATAVAEARSSPAVIAFEQAMDAFVADALANDRTNRAVDGRSTDVGAMLVVGAGATAQYDELVAAVTSEATRVGSEMVEQADRTITGVLWTFGALAAVSLAFAVVVAQSIARPLRRLTGAVRAARRGPVSRGRLVRGPREVRETATAVIEVGAQFALAERQALALAGGRLDDPVLSETAPGLLGTSLQEAVNTLAATLHDRERSRRRLAHDAAHDGLTDLLNRNASLAALERGVRRAQQGGGQVAVMFLDLDDFKSVNDRMGHMVGDHVLRVVAERLVETVRDGDLVGRLGGDEFVVMSALVNGQSDAIAIAERLRMRITDPVPYEDDIIFRIDASIGVAVTGPGDDTSAEELLRAADVAVYRAKDAGRGRIVLSEAGRGTPSPTRRDDLESAPPVGRSAPAAVADTAADADADGAGVLSR